MTAPKCISPGTSALYRKKPIVTEAWQWHFQREGELRGVCNCHEGQWGSHLHTMHDGQVVGLEAGDWIIPEPDGEHYYPCKPDVFANTYEAVDAGLAQAPVPADEVGYQLELLRARVQDALDMLLERKQGSAARSAAHNARLLLEAALSPVSSTLHCQNGLEHGNCLHPNCVSSCPGRLSLVPSKVRGDSDV